LDTEGERVTNREGHTLSLITLNSTEVRDGAIINLRFKGPGADKVGLRTKLSIRDTA